MASLRPMMRCPEYSIDCESSKVKSVRQIISVGTEIEISAEIKTGRQIKLALKSIFDI
jgi:hypothetical protein